MTLYQIGQKQKIEDILKHVFQEREKYVQSLYSSFIVANLDRIFKNPEIIKDIVLIEERLGSKLIFRYGFYSEEKGVY